MKRILKAIALSLLLVTGGLLQNTAKAQDYNNYGEDRDVSYQTFYDELSPYGQWVDYPQYGYVWVPEAGPDFRPYSTNGHWVWTDNYEWMWVSDYDWGWAPFHYGRWDYDNAMGWYWVPGYEWSSAWVAWRDGGDYYGWAPIRPGINISINFNIGGYSPPVDFWCFAPRRYITSPRIYDYCAPRYNNVTIIHQTTIIINNYNYGGSYGFRSGPRRYDAERYCGRINPVGFRDSYRPGRTEFRNNEVSIYRPRVRQDNNRQVAPRNFERYDRNSNTGFRRDNAQNNTNNNDGRRFDRNNDVVRQQQDNNTDRRRFDRNDNNQPGPMQRDRTVERPQQQQNNNNGNNPNDRRRFDRNDNNLPQPQQRERKFEPRPQQQNNDNPRPIQQERRFEPRPQQQQQQPQPQQNERRFERPQQVDRSQQQQPQQMERRFERPQQQPQVERRQQQPQPQPQQQERKFERRDNGNSQPGNDNGNGRGRGRKS